LNKQSAYQYNTTIPATLVKEGELLIAVRLKKSGNFIQTLRTVQVLDQTQRYELFNAHKVQQDTVLKSWWRIKNFPDWNRRTHYKFDTSNNGAVSYKASADTFNFDIPFIGWQYSCNMTNTAAVQYEKNYSTIRLTGAPANGKAANIRLILVDRDGNSYGRNLMLEGNSKTYDLPVSSFTKSPFLLIPRPYPMFLPLWFNSTVNPPLQLSAIEKMQVLYMPEENEKVEKEKGYLIEAIWGE
jgi:hypothetical protein